MRAWTGTLHGKSLRVSYCYIASLIMFFFFEVRFYIVSITRHRTSCQRVRRCGAPIIRPSRCMGPQTSLTQRITRLLFLQDRLLYAIFQVSLVFWPSVAEKPTKSGRSVFCCPPRNRTWLLNFDHHWHCPLTPERPPIPPCSEYHSGLYRFLQDVPGWVVY